MLVATRDLAVGEEVFWNYGSEKPFEHIRKQLEAQKQQSKKSEQLCKLVWVKHDADNG